MKKIIYRFFISAVCLACMQQSEAQISNITHKRMLESAALNRFDEYRAYHSLGDEEVYYNFLDLFVSDTTLVYNDQLGLVGNSRISIKEYADRQREKLQSPMIRFSNIKINRIWKDGNNWKVEISFNKTASYLNSCGISFSSMEFYGEEYKEKAILCFEDEKTCKIESISGTVNSNRSLADNYLIFVSKSERDARVKYSPKNGQKQNLTFNSFGQKLFEHGANVKDFYYSDPDVSVKPILNEECHTLEMQYKARRWRLHPHYDISLGNYYNIKTINNTTRISSSGSELGIDLGYSIPSKSIVKFSINIGIGFAMSKFDITQPAWNYSYETNGEADIDGDSYIRNYEIGDMTQSNSLSHLNIPIYVDADFCFSKKISAYIQAGVKNYLKISDKIKDYNFSDYIYGIYPQYDNLRLDEHWLQPNGIPYNGFGYHDITLDNVVSPSLNANGFTVDFFGGVGLRFKPFKTLPLAFDLGMQYQTSLMDIVNIEHGSLTTSNGNNASQQAISTYTISEGENYQLLSTGIKGMKRSQMKLNIGVVLKF
jgi:hypothetical protein